MKKNNTHVFENISLKLKKTGLNGELIVAAFMSSFMLAYVVQSFINGNFYDLQTYYNSIKFFLF